MRSAYPEGRNFVAAADVSAPFNRNVGPLLVEFINLPALVREAQGHFGKCLSDHSRHTE